MRRLRRIYFDNELKEVIELEEAESRKLKTVLRAEVGDTVEILTKDYLALGEIGLIGKRAVQVRILEKRDVKKPDYRLIAYQCVAKREYMDFIIEKYSELGVTDIVPVISARSLDTLKGNTLERYNTIAKEAALQCERENVAVIHAPQKIERLKPMAEENILFHERLGEKAMPAIQGRDISFIIGPEGGFTDKEFEHLVYIGFKPYTPIDTILKAETAGLLFAGLIRINL